MFVRFLVGVLTISAQRGRYHRFNTGTITSTTTIREVLRQIPEPEIVRIGSRYHRLVPLRGLAL